MVGYSLLGLVTVACLMPIKVKYGDINNIHVNTVRVDWTAPALPMSASEAIYKFRALLPLLQRVPLLSKAYCRFLQALPLLPNNLFIQG